MNILAKMVRMQADRMKKVKKKDTQIFPKFEEEFIGNNTYKRRPATQFELGGLVRRTTPQQNIIDNSGVNVQPKKKKPQLI